MSPQLVDRFFQIVVFLFAISAHESAHAWVAWRRGDATAYMLGRVTLNPIKHIDPIGTILLPIVAALTNFPLIGWAKPTPVNTRNFKNLVLDDILTTLAGPVSNFMLAIGALIGFFLIAKLVPGGSNLIAIAFNAPAAVYQSSSIFMPICVLLRVTMLLNLLLAVFNLIPIPPLDGSHVIRHFLPEGARRIYDMAGIFSIVILLTLGRSILGFLLLPVSAFFHWILASFVNAQ
jgi:Zn-dependent protease